MSVVTEWRKSRVRGYVSVVECGVVCGVVWWSVVRGYVSVVEPAAESVSQSV